MSELPEVKDNAVEATLVMINACNELFGDVKSEVTLPSLGENRVVHFKPAKFKHLEQITVLFESMATGFTNSEMVTMVKQVSAQQEAAINNGESPYKIDTNGLIGQVTENGSLMAKLMTRSLQTLPKLAPMFTDLTPEEFGELDVDEAMIVAFGIFARNYNFFTHRLPPVIAAFIAALKKRAK
jgi:hypothetical protein